MQGYILTGVAGNCPPVFLFAPARRSYNNQTCLEEAGDEFVLRSTGRYAHSIGYIRRLAQAAGLREVRLEESVLRMDKGQPINGYIVVLEKPEEGAR